MKKLIVVPVIAAVMLLAGSIFAPAHAQSPANADTPTFYHLVPGTYVNGWPRFTVTYPKDWVERYPSPWEMFRAAAPGAAAHPAFIVSIGSTPPPLDKYLDWLLPFLRARGTDLTVVVDKASHLRDGTPVREMEVQMVVNGGPFSTTTLVSKRGDLAIATASESLSEKTGEDLKAILYSIEFERNKDEPVKVPPDVQEFLEKQDSDILSHDLAKVMGNYSDGYLNSGRRKGEAEKNWRQGISGIMSIKTCITDFVPAGDRAHLAGFRVVNGLKFVLGHGSIIKENGEWRWYGNQRNPPPSN